MLSNFSLLLSPIGTYSKSGQSVCSVCKSGYFSTQVGSINCIICSNNVCPSSVEPQNCYLSVNDTGTLVQNKTSASDDAGLETNLLNVFSTSLENSTNLTVFKTNQPGIVYRNSTLIDKISKFTENSTNKTFSSTTNKNAIFLHKNSTKKVK